MRKDYSIFNRLKSYNTIIEILKDRSKLQPNDVCFRYLSYSGEEVRERNLTYGELDKKARQIAVYLKKKGMTGKCAILLYPGGLDFITAFFGCLYAKVIAVPLYHFLSKRRSDRIRAIIEDSEAKIFLTKSSEIKKINSFIIKNFQNKEFMWVATDTISDISCSDYDEAEIFADKLAYLQYTSGSTSLPKGVMITHRNIMHNMELMCWDLVHTSNSIGVSWLPHFHDMGLVAMILQPLYVGYTQVLMQPADFLTKPYRFLKAVSDYRGTTIGAPNFSFDHCVASITQEQKKMLDLSSLETAFNGAETVHWSTIESFKEAFKECGLKDDVLIAGYGLAEATLYVMCGNQESKPRHSVIIDIDKDELKKNKTAKVAANKGNINTLRYVSVGRSRQDVNLIIVDPVTGKKCVEGKVGEIWIASESVSPGYWKNKMATEEMFCAHISDTGDGPFLRTGDLGFMIEGELYITGRLKDVIIIRGVNYYPNDIEFIVGRCHPALVSNSGCAFSIKVKNEEKLYVAQEVKRSYQKNFDPDEVFNAIRKAVVDFHGLQVHGILLLRIGRIPKTSSGKIQRNRCKEVFLKGELEIIHKSIIDDNLNKSYDMAININDLLKPMRQNVRKLSRINWRTLSN